MEKQQIKGAYKFTGLYLPVALNIPPFTALLGS
jgi:hypothetical protein